MRYCYACVMSWGARTECLAVGRYPASVYLSTLGFRGGRTA